MAPLDLQVFMLLVVVVFGMAAGLLFDLLRVWRRVARPRRLWAHVADAGYALAVGILLAVGLLFLNWLQVRTFVLLGLLVGALLYFSLASAAVLAVLTRFLGFAARALRAGAQAGSALGERAAAVARARARALQGRVTPPVQRAHRWGQGLVRRIAAWWRRFPGFLA